MPEISPLGVAVVVLAMIAIAYGLTWLIICYVESRPVLPRRKPKRAKPAEGAVQIRTRRFGQHSMKVELRTWTDSLGGWYEPSGSDSEIFDAEGLTDDQIAERIYVISNHLLDRHAQRVRLDRLAKEGTIDAEEG